MDHHALAIRVHVGGWGNTSACGGLGKQECMRGVGETGVHAGGGGGTGVHAGGGGHRSACVGEMPM